MPQRQSARDYAILVAFEAGRTLEQLAGDYGLKADRIRTIVIAERNRRIISPEPFYRSLRQAKSNLSASF